MSYTWESSLPNRHIISNESVKKENVEAVRAQPIQNEEVPAVERKVHDFIRTHFHRATHCDFCTKKVIYIYALRTTLYSTNTIISSFLFFFFASKDLVERCDTVQGLRYGMP